MHKEMKNIRPISILKIFVIVKLINSIHHSTFIADLGSIASIITSIGCDSMVEGG